MFPSNVFIYKYQFVQDAEYVDYRFHHDCNVYAVVKSDTNRDKLLNSSDDISIYVSEYDGTHLEEVSPSVISFKFIADNEFLFTEYDGAMLLYFVYDCKSGTKELIKSVEQDIELNSIDMS